MSKKDTNPLGLTKKDFSIQEAKGKKATTIVGQDDLYASHRPDGVDAKVEKAVDNYRADFVSSTIAVAGAIGLDHLAKNKKEDSVNFNVQMSNRSNSIRGGVTRERSVSQGAGKDRTMKKGMVSLNVRTSYGRKVGGVKTACEEIAEKALKKL